MLDDTLILSDLYLDAVSEVLNVGMGSAAAALSEMTCEVVNLSVPNVKFVSRLEATNMMGRKAESSVSGISQHFNGVFSGDALLLFPEKQSLELVRAVLQEDIESNQLSVMEQEAMTEIGNVILNSCLCSMADMLGKEMKGDMPAFIQGTLKEVFSYEGELDPTRDIVLMLHMLFTIDNKDIQGYVTFIMDIEAMEDFKKLVTTLVDL